MFDIQSDDRFYGKQRGAGLPGLLYRRGHVRGGGRPSDLPSAVLPSVLRSRHANTNVTYHGDIRQGEVSIETMGVLIKGPGFPFDRFVTELEDLIFLKKLHCFQKKKSRP